jgi:hypothetical protein
MDWEWSGGVPSMTRHDCANHCNITYLPNRDVP